MCKSRPWRPEKVGLADCFNIMDSGNYESIPHRFLGITEFAVEPVSMVIVEMKPRKKLSSLDHMHQDAGKPFFRTCAIYHMRLS